MIEQIADLPAGMLGFEAHGRVTAKDHTRVLEPAIDRGVLAHGKINLLYRLARDFTGYTAGALWADGRLGARHWRHFDRIAIVTDSRWIGWLTRTIGRLMPADVRVLQDRDLEAATRWVSKTESVST